MSFRWDKHTHFGVFIPSWSMDFKLNTFCSTTRWWNPHEYPAHQLLCTEDVVAVSKNYHFIAWNANEDQSMLREHLASFGGRKLHHWKSFSSRFAIDLLELISPNQTPSFQRNTQSHYHINKIQSDTWWGWMLFTQKRKGFLQNKER